MGWVGKKEILLSEHIHAHVVTVAYILSSDFLYTHHIEYFGWIPAWLKAFKVTAHGKWKAGV